MAEETKVAEAKQVPETVKDITGTVLSRIKKLEEEQGLTYPEGYNPANELKAFQLELENTKDKNERPALQVCTTASIANAMLNMVTQGLRVSTKQCYLIVYGDQLTLQRSYFGSEAVAKRVCPYLDQKPWHPVLVYEGEEFSFAADTDNGGYKVLEHKPNLDAIDKGNIKATYLIVKDAEGKTLYTEIMTWNQILKAWNQSKNSSNNKLQTNFKDQAAIRSIIGRVAKRYLNTANIKDVNLAKAVAETKEEDFEDVTPKFEGAEASRRAEILSKLASLPTPITEQVLIENCNHANSIDDVPTSFLEEVLTGETN